MGKSTKHITKKQASKAGSKLASSNSLKPTKSKAGTTLSNYGNQKKHK